MCMKIAVAVMKVLRKKESVWGAGELLLLASDCTVDAEGAPNKGKICI